MADMSSHPVDVYLPSKLNCIDVDFIVERCGRGCGGDCEHSDKYQHLGGAAAQPVTCAKSPKRTVTDAAPGASASLHGTLTVHCMPSLTIHGRSVSCVRGRIEAVYYKAGRRMATVEWGLINHPHTGRLEKPRNDANVRPHFFHQGAFRLLRRKSPSDQSHVQSGSGRHASCAARYECESKESRQLMEVHPKSVKPSDLVVGAIVEKDWVCSDFHADELFPPQKPSGFTVRMDQRTDTLNIEVALPAPPSCMRTNQRSVNALQNVLLVPLAQSAKAQRGHYCIVDDVLTVEHVLDFYRGGPGPFAHPIVEAAALSKPPDAVLGVAILAPAGVPIDLPGGGDATGGAAHVSVGAGTTPELPAQPVLDPQEHFFWARVASILADTFRVGDVVLGCHVRHRGNGENSEEAINFSSANCASECLRQHFWFNEETAAASESSNCEHLVFTVKRTVLINAVSILAHECPVCIGHVLAMSSCLCTSVLVLCAFPGFGASCLPVCGLFALSTVWHTRCRRYTLCQWALRNQECIPT